MYNVFSRCPMVILRGLALLLASITFLILAGVAQANPGDLDPTFNPDGLGPNAPVLASAVQTDSKIIIGGYFTRTNGVETNAIARLNTDGSLDPTFNIGTGASLSYNFVPSVNAIVIQPDGKILIAGDFRKFNGENRNYVARLNPDGSVDASFDTSTSDTNGIFAMALQPDGKILVGGYNGFSGNVAVITRLNTDGSNDTSFNTGTLASGAVYSIIVLPDQKIIIGGSLFSKGSQSLGAVVRLNNDGSHDSEFAPNEQNQIAVIKRQPDGKIIVGGAMFSGSPSTRITYLARFNENGERDNTFAPASAITSPLPTSTTIMDLALEVDGKVLISGLFSDFGGSGNNSIVRLNSDGSVDPSFSSGNPADTRSDRPLIGTITKVQDGKILIGGQFTSYAGQPISYFARLRGATDCNPLKITAIEDDGTGNTCGTFSHALQNVASPNVTVTFALTQGNTITLTGALVPDVPVGTIIDGGNGNGIIINGINGDGLRLSGDNTLINLTVQRFGGREIVTKSAGYNNKLRNVRVAS